MIHLYTNKHYRNGTVKLLCSGECIAWNHQMGGVTTVHHNVTCPKCLDMLIPKAQEKLDRMKRSREMNHQEVPNEVSV